MSRVYKFYNELSSEDKQYCDLCIDWGLTHCDTCEIYSHYIHKKGEGVLITLYTIGCKNCDILEKKLKTKNIEFVRVSDEDTIKAKGFGDSFFPILDVDGVVMSYKTAIQWVNNQ